MFCFCFFSVLIFCLSGLDYGDMFNPSILVNNSIPISCVFRPILHTCCTQQVSVVKSRRLFCHFTRLVWFFIFSSFLIINYQYTNTFFVYCTFCVYSEHPNSLYYDPYFVVASHFYLGMTLPIPTHLIPPTTWHLMIT